MRRIVLPLAAIAITAGMALASPPASAHEGGWGYRQAYQQEWRGHEWRRHQQWRAAAFERHMLPRLFHQMFRR